MKKLTLLLVVLVISQMVYGQEPVTITASAVGDTLTIGYDASSAAAMPVGISLLCPGVMRMSSSTQA